MVGVGDGLVLGRAPSPNGHLHRVDDELGPDVIGDRPPHNATAEGVEHHRQVHLALVSRMVGDVHHPQVIGLGRIEGPIDQIVGRLSDRVSTRAASAPAPVDPGDTGLAHQALHPLARTADVLAEHQLGVHPGRAIAVPAHGVDVDDGVGQQSIGEVPLAHRSRLPGIKGRDGHPHDPTARCDRQVLAALGDEGVGHFGRGRLSLAKKAAARRRISTSVSATRSLRRSSTNSARSEVDRPSRRPVSMSAWRSQLRRQLSAMPRSLASWAIATVPSRANLNARRRNSRMGTRHTDSFPEVLPPQRGCPVQRGMLTWKLAMAL